MLRLFLRFGVDVVCMLCVIMLCVCSVYVACDSRVYNICVVHIVCGVYCLLCVWRVHVGCML